MTDISLLQKWYDEVWNNANENFIDSMLHEQAIIHGLKTDNEKRGMEAFKPFYKTFRETFPQVHVVLEPIFSNGEFQAAQCTVTTKSSDGAETNFTGLTIARFVDDKLVEGWNGFDFLTMYEKLGYKLSNA